MQRYHYPIAIVLILLALVTVSACARPSAPEPSPAATVTVYPLTLTDDAGRSVTLPAKPVRILTLAPGHTETLFALGLGEAVVGTDDYSDYPAAAAAVAKVGGAIDPNYEQIVALAPDLVLTVGSADSAGVQRLTALGLPVVVLQATTVADILADIETIGRITGVSAAAADLVADLAAEIAAVQAELSQIAPVEQVTVFYEVSPPGEWGMWTAGPGSFIHDLVVLAGGSNIAGDLPAAYSSYSEEMLFANNPQVILTPNPETPAGITSRDGWETLSAVQAGRVYLVDADTVSRPGPRIVSALRLIAAALYPERIK